MNDNKHADGGIDLSISLLKANIFSLPIVLLSIAVTYLPFRFFWGIDNLFAEFSGSKNFLLLLVFFFVGIVLHELIHAVSWRLFAKIPFSRIKFGFNVKSLSPYAHCGEPVTAKVYRMALVAPAILLGIIPVAISFVTGSVWFFILGELFTITASGDFLIFWLIRKVKNEQLVADHPERAGCKVVVKSGY